MTEEENDELKKNQQKLSQNLQQLEKITTRVKHLVGLADKSFKKKWEELEKAGKKQVEEDLNAGGDAKELSNQLIQEPSERMNSERGELSSRKEKVTGREVFNEPIKSAKTPRSSRKPPEHNDFCDVSSSSLDDDANPAQALSSRSHTMKTFVASENENDNCQENGHHERPVTPRTKLKNDLKKLADEINADFEDSEMETADEVETPAGLSKPALANLEKSIKAYLDKDESREAHDGRGDDIRKTSAELDKMELKANKMICQEGKSCSMMPSIPALEGLTALKTPSLPSIEADAKSVPEVMLSLTGRLSESYSMQEKLAAENADLEGLRYRRAFPQLKYQLQEELITKENAVELLQRKVANLQAEMRLIARENAQLNDKLVGQGMTPGFEDKVTVKVAPPTADDVVDMKLQEYKETTQTLESAVTSLECEVKRIQQELACVQKERQELENHRKMMKININVQRRGMGTHGGLINPLPPRDSNTELQMKELKEQYDRLKQDFNNKMLTVASLRAQNDKLMEITDKAREERDFCEEQCKSLEKRLKQLETEKTKMMGSKEQLFEQEQQMSLIKLRYREAQDEIDELRNQLGDQTAQVDDYRNKYLQAQQQVEEQIRQIDHMELENQRMREEQAAEIQRVKQCFQEKLSELAPLPDILKETQLKLQEAQQLRMIAERNKEDLQREFQEAKEKSNGLLRRMESEISSQQLGLDERSQMNARLECLEKKNNEMREENAKLKTTVARLEEASTQNEKRLDEKLHEVAQYTTQLETLREESARQVARCKDRNETIKRSLQNQIADLERQLAQARATARTAQKDKDEVRPQTDTAMPSPDRVAHENANNSIRQRMQSQINNLNDNFEEAQLRIKSLQSNVNFLKNSCTGLFNPEPSSMSLVDSGSNFLIEAPCNPCDCSY
ncbi:hypothetical protein RUM43_002788 [Polyplax serrata]|uniref:Uncharacterized protein n=1 Tax=Polyplax serrata TaxID=468196 RepID=A0AAN8S998_POLSC